MWLLVGIPFGLIGFILFMKQSYKVKGIARVGLFMALAVLSLTASWLIPMLLYSPSKFSKNINYKADVYIENVQDTIYFNDFVQKENCVFISDYYTYDGWQMKINHDNKSLIIKLPPNTVFNYDSYNDDLHSTKANYQHVVNDCSEP